MEIIHYEKWDIHHHIIPEFYIDDLRKDGIITAEKFGWQLPPWTEEMQSKMMKKHNITRAFMSISAPGVYFGGDLFVRKFARKCNEYMAEMIKDNPDKLRAFASVPLPDVEGAIQELKYSLDILKFDGIGLLSNVNGKYLGSKEYRSFFEELNWRNAIVFIHPTVPPGKMDNKLLNVMYLFLLDTTRTIIDFIRSGYHRDFPNIKFILSHGGGVLPAIYPFLMLRLKEENPAIESEFEKWKPQLYLDTARIPYYDYTMATSINLVGINHMLLGTDFAWATIQYPYWLKQISTLKIEQSYIQDVFKGNAEQALYTTAPNPPKYISIPDIEPFHIDNKGDEVRVKYHFHCNPAGVIEGVANIDKSFKQDQVNRWDMNEAMGWMAENNYQRLMLSLDMPHIWGLNADDIAAILNLSNKEIAQIRNQEPKRLGAFGAVDVDNVQHALDTIDHCLKDLKLNGICIYTRVYDTKLEDIIDLRILNKLKETGVPVLVHPKDSRGIPISNENYLDSVYFIAKMLYMGKFGFLKDNKYILTHTGGIVPFLAQDIGILYYLQLNKNSMRKFMFDWLILKYLKGYEFLRRITIDD